MDRGIGFVISPADTYKTPLFPLLTTVGINLCNWLTVTATFPNNQNMQNMHEEHCVITERHENHPRRQYVAGKKKGERILEEKRREEEEVWIGREIVRQTERDYKKHKILLI